MNHFDNLRRLIPHLETKSVLDVGAGRGKFLLDLASRGVDVTGVEPYAPYREEIARRGALAGMAITVLPGTAENLPFPDVSFDFLNLSEVIEHVERPREVATEVFRVLREGGSAYVSVPNRFGFKDQHFHIYGVNWLPRAWADACISLFGTHKHYDGSAGRQRLCDMHYMTFGSARSLFRSAGFSVADIREARIHEAVGFFDYFFLPLYRLLRFAYFDSFHLLLTK